MDALNDASREYLLEDINCRLVVHMDYAKWLINARDEKSLRILDAIDKQTEHVKAFRLIVEHASESEIPALSKKFKEYREKFKVGDEYLPLNAAQILGIR